MLNPRSLLQGATAVERLFQLEKKHGAILEAQSGEIQTLRDRLTTLEQRVMAREEILIAEAKAAAAAAASAVASHHIADIARRLGGMEERLRPVPERRNLPALYAESGTLPP